MAFDLENSDGVTISYNVINKGSELEVARIVSGLNGSVEIPEEVTYNDITRKVTSIGSWAFYKSKDLISVTIPNSVTRIGDGAFYECINLTSVTIPNSVASIGDYAFSYCSGLTSITIPNSVTHLGDYSFCGCTGLTSIPIPNSLASIGICTFAECSGLFSVTIPISVTGISDYAFFGCSSMSSITIPNSVKSIGEHAYDGWDISEVVSEIDNPYKINTNTFTDNTYNNATLYVPEGTIDKYKATDSWNKFHYIKEGSPTFIKNIESDETIELKCYTLDGRISNTSLKGIKIIQMKNGTTIKVFVK